MNRTIKSINKNYKTFYAVFPLFYFFLLIFNINSPYLMVADEAVYSSTVNDLFSGVVGNNNHPLLAKTIWMIIVGFFYIITGTDHAFYWRVGTIFFSLGSLFVFYKISRLFFSKQISLLSTTFLALDPMFFSFGRLVMLDVPALFFLLLFIYFYLIFISKKRINYLLIGAFFLGLSLAVKLFAFPLLLLIPLYLFVTYKNYFFTYMDWLKNILKFTGITLLAYTFGNIIFFFKQTSQSFLMYTYAQIATEPGFKELIAKSADSTSSVFSWFIIPQIQILYRVFPGRLVQTIVGFQNPVLFFTTIPIIFATIYFLIKKNKKYNFLHLQLLIIFFSLYLPWSLPIRPTYYYYIVPLIPIPIILLIQFVLNFKKTYKNILWALLVVQLLVFVAYYPILTGVSIPYNYERVLMSYSVYKFPDRNSVTCQLCSPLNYPKHKKLK